MVVVIPRGRGPPISVRPEEVRSGDIILRGDGNFVGGGGSGGGGGGGVTTREAPTPSAERLFGTSEEREAQIRAFRRGGEAEFRREIQRAQQRVEEEKRMKLREQQRAEEVRQELERKKEIAQRLRREKPVSEVQPARLSKPEEFIARTQTRVIRGERVGVKERATLFVVSAGTTIASFPKETFQFGKALLTQPVKTIKEIPTGIKTAGTQFFAELEGPTPEVPLGRLTGEVVALKGAGKVAGAVTKGVKVGTTRLSPKFVKTTEKGIKGVPLKRGEVDIKLAGPVKQIKEPLSKQVRLAGKEVDVVSAQTDFLKPLTKRKLELERTFFGDPRGRARVSRLDLGKTPKEASVLDILSGEEITFRRGRKQLLVFEKAMVEKFPRRLIDVETKLKRGRTLTKMQERRLIEFQETPSGQFKPIGFLSTEPEVILPAGETLKRGKKVAVTLIKGEPVEIITPKIVKISAKDIQLKKPTTTNFKQLKNLEKRIRTSTSKRIISKPFVSPSRISVSPISLRKFTKKISRVPKIRSPISPKITIPKYPSRIIGRRAISPPSLKKLSSIKRSPIGKRKIISPPISRLVSTPMITRSPIISYQKFKQIKLPKVKTKGKEDVALVEGFIARQLGLKPIKISKTDIGKAIKKQELSLGIRRAVIIK